MPKMSRKWRRQAPLGETLALSGHNHHPATQTLAPLGLLQPAKCAKQAQHAALCSRKRPASPGWRPIHLGQRPICKGLIPIGQVSAKNVLMRASFFFLVQGLVTTLSCLCRPNNRLMGSSAPWRSELIISPCAPILWYLSAGHGPAHQRLRPPGAHHS
jgi:hypothetical protein